MDDQPREEQPLTFDLDPELLNREEAKKVVPARVGDLCPHCGEARLDYNGMLNLACPRCGYELGGCFT